jgi:hypothetical protein
LVIKNTNLFEIVRVTANIFNVVLFVVFLQLKLSLFLFLVRFNKVCDIVALCFKTKITDFSVECLIEGFNKSHQNINLVILFLNIVINCENISTHEKW